MALHSVFSEKKGISMEKKNTLLLQIYSDVLVTILVLCISGSKAENCSVGFCIVFKISLIVSQISLLSRPTYAPGNLYLAHFGFCNKGQLKTDSIP